MRNDFVKVRLSSKGVELAAGGPITVAGGRYEFAVREGEELEVTRAYEWLGVLAEVRAEGEQLFELVPETE